MAERIKFHGFGSRLRRALTGDDAKPVSPPPAEFETAISELSNANFIAAGQFNRAYRATNYRNSAERIRSDLNSAKVQLEQAILKFSQASQSNNSRIKREHMSANFTLARVNVALGNYDEAERLYNLFCPPVLLDIDTNQVISNMSTLEKQEIEGIIAYLRFMGGTGRNLEYGERLGRLMAPLTQDHHSNATTPEEKCGLLLGLSRIYIARGDYEQAWECTEQLLDLEPEALPKASTIVTVPTSQAIALAGLNQKTRSEESFLRALVRSAVLYGMWHSRTLETLYYYGKALLSWANYEAAATILTECCLGRYHRNGAAHPSSERAYAELAQCEGSKEHCDTVQRFDDDSTNEEYKFSLAYEHTYLNTIVDLLASAGITSFDKVGDILEELLEDKQTLRVDSAEHHAILILRVHRAVARCTFQFGKVEAAISLVEGLGTTYTRSVEGKLQSSLDLIMYYAGDTNRKAKAIELSREIFFDVDTRLNRDQAVAFQRRLTQLGFTHFTQDCIAKNPLPIKVLENVGTGAYAIVESVDIGSRLYARKSIGLPRYNQNRIRQTIQNEISVIRSLAHPHIVQVYFTYEEKSRFAIVLHPLASCDLEAYLETNQQSTQSEPNAEHKRLIWQWFRCLANALAFIHSKGVRHKDIKTRNILIKDSKIVFADFGSSHAFLDEGTSVTEGPAFGHTLMYCAPEVISWDKRSRSADVFSLGCVFTEMATSLGNRSISDYFEFRHKSTENGETHAYHATLDLVISWFQVAVPLISGIYCQFIYPMLLRDPELRPTALETSSRIQDCYLSFNSKCIDPCSECGPTQLSLEMDASIVTSVTRTVSPGETNSQPAQT